MKRKIKVLSALILCVAAIFVFAGCKKDQASQTAVDTNVLDMSLEDAKKQVTDAGCIPVTVTVYDDTKEDGAVLSLGEFMKDAKSGDYITIAVNDLTLKEDLKEQPLAPRIIEKSSYEKNIYAKISKNETIKKKFDSFYTLKSADNVKDKELEALYRSYPVAKNMSIYVLDTGVSEKELLTIAEYVSNNTDYSYDDLFEDYIKVGLIPTPSTQLNAEVLSADNCKLSPSDNSVSITAYTGNSQNIVVPAEIDGKTVTKIASGAIPQSDIHALTTQSGLTTIENKALLNAYGILNITLSDTIKEVGTKAFGSPLFTTKSEDGFETMGDILVKYSGTASEVSVPENLRFIGSEAFAKNEQITKVTLPKGIQSIGENAFKECSNLVSCNIPETCIKICDGAFYQNRLFEEIVIPASTTDIGEAAFFECNAAKSITLGENVKTIGPDAFNYCYTITELNIPASVEYIGNNAFYKCTGLQTVTGGEGVKYMGSAVFEEDPWYNNLSTTGDTFSFFGNGILIKYNGKDAEITLPDNTVCLSSAFMRNKRITKVVINEGCTTITKDAFTETPKLMDVTIPASVTSIDEKAFDAGNTDLVFHCPAGSEAEKFVIENHFKYDNNMQ